MNDILTSIEDYRDFKIVRTSTGDRIQAYDNLFPIMSPLSVELTCYRHNLHSEGLMHMRNAHDIIWPQHIATWNDWTERRFSAHLEPHKVITWAAGANALQLTEKVSTPTGWTTIGELEVGDVISSIGGAQNVTELHPIKTLPYYKITFTDKTSIECCGDHMWPVTTTDRTLANLPYTKLTAKELYENRDVVYSLMESLPVFYTEQPIKIDPYVLGVFLHKYRCHTARNKGKSMIVQDKYPAVQMYLDSLKLPFKTALRDGRSYSLNKYKEGFAIYKGAYTRDYFIPDEYLYNTLEVRANLLAGILDTVPKFYTTHARLSVASLRLARDIVQLARSLGYRVTIHPNVSVNAVYIYGTSNHYMLPLRSHMNLINGTNAARRIVNIEPCGDRTGRCITVSDPMGCFIVTGFLATSNSGKSFDAAKLALLFYFANPTQRTVLIASTSLSDLDSRIWGYVKRFYSLLARVTLPGVIYDSPPPKILMNKRDTIHGMFAVPLQRGAPTKTASTLIGRHPDEGFLAIIDEGTDVTPGFMEAVPNWEKAPLFQMIVIGNSCSMFDPHGILSQPVTGWDTVSPDYDTEWKTKRGICLYFDCYKSPAILDPDPVKRKALAKFLFTEASIEKSVMDYGKDSPEFWRFTRGFWPPEDTTKTILTPVMVDKFRVKELSHWSGTDRIYTLAGLDPAFTADGDACILRFAKLGKTVGGRWELDFGGAANIHRLKILADAEEPAEYQIVQQAMNLCAEAGVEPKNFAVDVHGMGSGLGAIFDTVWSKDIYKVTSGGFASNLYVDYARTIRARDIYDRRITELWFSMQKFVQSGQIKGLDSLTCQQFCTRIYEWKGKKYSIETKKAYKLRLGKVDSKYVSPDHADTACMILDLVRKAYNFVPHSFVDSSSLGPATAMQKYFAQEERDHGVGGFNSLGGGVRSGHPASWGDGFLVSDSDIEEN